MERKTPLITWGGVIDPGTGTEVKVDYSVAMHIAFAEQAPAEVREKEVLDVLFAPRDYIAGEVIPNLQPLL